MDFKTWWNGKVNSKRQGKLDQHEHVLSESSVTAGQAVCVAISSTEPSTVLDRDRDLMVPSALASGAKSLSTTSPTRSSTTCSPTTSLSSSLASVDGVDSNNSNSKKHPVSGAMVKVRTKDAQEVRVACKRNSALAGAKKLLALCALSIPLGVNMRGLERTSQQDGVRDRLPFASSSRTRCNPELVQCCQSGRLHLAEEQSGFEGGFHGRPTAGRNAGGQVSKGHGSSVEEGSICRSPKASKSVGFSRQAAVRSTRTSGSQGRSAHTQEGSDQVGSLLGATHRREGHSGSDEVLVATSGVPAVHREAQSKLYGKQQQATNQGEAFTQTASQDRRTLSTTTSRTRHWQRSLPSAFGIPPSRSPRTPPGRSHPMAVPMDVQSVLTESDVPGMSREEELMLGGQEMDYIYHQSLAAQYGEEALEGLTRDEIERVIDP